MTSNTPERNDRPQVWNQANMAAILARDIFADSIEIYQSLKEQDSRCPAKLGGCGGPVEKLARVWLSESNNDSPRSELGRMVAPPERPIPPGTVSDDPELRFPSPPPPPDLASEEDRINQMLSNRGKSIATKMSLLGIGCLTILGSVVHQTNPNRDNPAPVILAITFGCVVLIAIGFAWFNIATAPITRQRAILFEMLRHDYQSELESFESEKARFNTEMLIYKERCKIWLDSWHCTRCGLEWRSVEVDKIADLEIYYPPHGFSAAHSDHNLEFTLEI